MCGRVVKAVQLVCGRVVSCAGIQCVAVRSELCSYSVRVAVQVFSECGRAVRALVE